MKKLKDNFQPVTLLRVEVVVHHLDHLLAMTQLLVDHLGPLPDCQVSTGGQVQVLQVLPDIVRWNTLARSYLSQ